MNNFILKTVLMMGLFLILNCNLCLAFSLEVRPLKIKVVDAATKKPIPEIKVYYVLTTDYPEMSCIGYFFYPTFIDDAIRTMRQAVKLDLRTDENGEIAFAGKKLKRQCYERINSEKVIVNLEVDPKIAKTFENKYNFFSHSSYIWHPEYLIPIDKRYKGFVLEYVDKIPNHEELFVKDKYYREMYEKKISEKMEALMIATDLQGHPEEYIVELPQINEGK